MGWETDKHGTSRYVQKVRKGRKVTSKVLGTGDDGIAAEQRIFAERQANREQQLQDRETDSKTDEYDRAVDEAIDRYLILNGYIKRKNEWHRVSRLKTPLTKEEIASIRHAKYQSRKTMLQNRENQNADSIFDQISKIFDKKGLDKSR